MLVLKRKKNESLLINNETKITVLEVGYDWVRLSINAPKDVSILRSELIEAANLNKESTSIDKSALSSLQNFLIKQ